MPDSITAPLIVDFLEWLAKAPRPYAEVMEAWRTSCPRMTIWEDALELGYVIRRRDAAGEPVVALTPLGARRLEQSAGTPLATA